MTQIPDDEDIRHLQSVRSSLRAKGRSDLVEKVTEVIAALEPASQVATPSLLSTGEAAAILGVRSINTIKRWAGDGLLEGYRLGGRIKITRASVEALLRSPIAERQRVFERELDRVLEPFDAQDAALPPTDRAHRGRKPWDVGQHGQ